MQQWALWWAVQQGQRSQGRTNRTLDREQTGRCCAWSSWNNELDVCGFLEWPGWGAKVVRSLNPQIALWIILLCSSPPPCSRGTPLPTTNHVFHRNTIVTKESVGHRNRSSFTRQCDCSCPSTGGRWLPDGRLEKGYGKPGRQNTRGERFNAKSVDVVFQTCVGSHHIGNKF